MTSLKLMKEQSEDINWRIRCHKSKKDRQYSSQEKNARGQTVIYKTLNRKSEIEQQKSH